MNEHAPQMPAEIATLVTRAGQLEAAKSACGVHLARLAAESEAARSAEDGAASQRIGRKIHLEEQRAQRVSSELETLLTLIAARRARYGLR